MIINASAHNMPLADKSVHAIVTSPPYFGLRKYEGDQEIDWPAGVYSPCTDAPACIEVPAMRCGFGTEKTIKAYIWHSLLILRECRRVLRDDGTLWLNLGDSYSAQGKNGGSSGNKNYTSRDGGYIRDKRCDSASQGNLLGVPHRLMLAAQADGWIVRNDCVWSKITTMPESVYGSRWERCRVLLEKDGYSRQGDGKGNGRVAHGAEITDRKDRAKWAECLGCDDCAMNDGYVLRRGSWRHTRAHEYIFQFTKGRGYWADDQIVKEPTTGGAHSRGSGITPKTTEPGQSIKQNSSFRAAVNELVSSRNPRSVFTPPPSAYSGQHFAVFPPELIRPLILSSVPRRCCPHCGVGWAPVVDRRKFDRSNDRKVEGMRCQLGKVPGGNTRGCPDPETVTRGYRPTCSCGLKIGAAIPGILLDPFCGSGTSGEVARECGVSFIGLDISFPYLRDQAMWRSERKHSIEKINELPLFAGAV